MIWRFVLASIALAGSATAVADMIQAYRENSPGWALIWRGQIILCSVLLASVLVDQ